jgi:hypothetical protein
MDGLTRGAEHPLKAVLSGGRSLASSPHYYQYQNNCDLQPSAREKYHAAIAYSRPVGNRDPDDDGQTSVVLSLPHITVY